LFLYTSKTKTGSFWGTLTQKGKGALFDFWVYTKGKNDLVFYYSFVKAARITSDTSRNRGPEW